MAPTSRGVVEVATSRCDKDILQSHVGTKGCDRSDCTRSEDLEEIKVRKNTQGFHQLLRDASAPLELR